MKRVASHELLPPPTNCVRIRTREANRSFDVPRARLDSLPFASGIKSFNEALDGEDDSDEVYLPVSARCVEMLLHYDMCKKICLREGDCLAELENEADFIGVDMRHPESIKRVSFEKNLPGALDVVERLFRYCVNHRLGSMRDRVVVCVSIPEASKVLDPGKPIPFLWGASADQFEDYPQRTADYVERVQEQATGIMSVAFDSLQKEENRASREMRQRLSDLSIEPISKADVFKLAEQTSNVPMFMLQLSFEQAYPEQRDETRAQCPATTGIFELYDDDGLPHRGGLARIVATPFVRPAFKHVSAAIFRLR